MRYLIAILFTLAGCAGNDRPPVIWSDDIAFAAPLWQREAEARFGPAVRVFACHGLTSDNGQWLCSPRDDQAQSVESLARALADAEPDVTWVFVVCNPNHRTITVPGGHVYYSRRNVSTHPHDGATDRDDSIWQFAN